jgi:hypothetical protein
MTMNIVGRQGRHEKGLAYSWMELGLIRLVNTIQYYMDGMLEFRHEVVTVQMACRPRNAVRLGAATGVAEKPDAECRGGSEGARWREASDTESTSRTPRRRLSAAAGEKFWMGKTTVGMVERVWCVWYGGMLVWHGGPHRRENRVSRRDGGLGVIGGEPGGREALIGLGCRHRDSTSRV